MRRVIKLRPFDRALVVAYAAAWVAAVAIAWWWVHIPAHGLSHAQWWEVRRFFA